MGQGSEAGRAWFSPEDLRSPWAWGRGVGEEARRGRHHSSDLGLLKSATDLPSEGLLAAVGTVWEASPEAGRPGRRLPPSLEAWWGCGPESSGLHVYFGSRTPQMR